MLPVFKFRKQNASCLVSNGKKTCDKALARSLRNIAQKYLSEISPGKYVMYMLCVALKR